MENTVHSVGMAVHRQSEAPAACLLFVQTEIFSANVQDKCLPNKSSANIGIKN
jgi:hypothetical protein